MDLKTIVIIIDFILIFATASWFLYRLFIGMNIEEQIFSWFYSTSLLISLVLNLSVLSK